MRNWTYGNFGQLGATVPASYFVENTITLPTAMTPEDIAVNYYNDISRAEDITNWNDAMSSGTLIPEGESIVLYDPLTINPGVFPTAPTPTAGPVQPIVSTLPTPVSTPPASSSTTWLQSILNSIKPTTSTPPLVATPSGTAAAPGTVSAAQAQQSMSVWNALKQIPAAPSSNTLLLVGGGLAVLVAGAYFMTRPKVAKANPRRRRRR